MAVTPLSLLLFLAGIRSLFVAKQEQVEKRRQSRLECGHALTSESGSRRLVHITRQVRKNRKPIHGRFGWLPRFCRRVVR